MNTFSTNPTLVAAASLAAVTLSAAESQSVDSLIAQIKDKDDKVRGAAWQGAGPCGAPAVRPLASVMVDSDMEVARAAKRGLWKIVRYAGRPGADSERKAVVKELAPLLQGQPAVVRREVVWMLSEIAGKDDVPAIAALLSDSEVREDARAALIRIPGDQAVAALKSALKTVPEDFKPAIAQSLRVRGVKIAEYPNQKLVPTRPAPTATPKQI
jgi:HEAT repeat protein